MKAAGVGDGRVFDRMGSLSNVAMGAITTGATLAVAGLAAASAAIVGIGAASLNAFGNLERLTLGLQAVEGSAEVAGQRLAELRELARAPGLGFEQAVGAFGQLRNAGASSSFAQSLIREIGNANARGGGGAAEFGNVMRQIAQTLNRPFLQGEELNSFREAQLPVDQVLRGRFGTSDTEELKRQGVSSMMVLTAIVEEFSRMERVAGGFTNSLDNLKDSVNTSLAEIGKGLAPGVMQIVGTIESSFSELTDSGVLALFGQTLAQIGNEVGTAFQSGAGGISLSEALIDFGASLIDVAAILGGIGKAFAAVAQAIPILGELSTILGAFSGGAGAEFKASALAALGRTRTGGSGGSLDQFTNSVTSAPQTNPVQQRQLAAQEAIARNTAELVRFEQSAFGGGDILRRGISMSDAKGFNSGGGRGSNAKQNFYDAIDAMIAQQVARGTA
jgi:tape measure domain-containing protein